MEVLHQVLRSVLPHRLRPGPEELPDRVRGEGKVRLPEPQLRAGELREAREGTFSPHILYLLTHAFAAVRSHFAPFR